MALTRSFLSAIGLDEDKVEEVIKKHLETVNGLKDERDELRTKADELQVVQEELNKLKETANDDELVNEYKEKYENAIAEFESFKAEQEQKEIKNQKINAYKTILKNVGVDEKRIDTVLKVTDVDAIEIEDGKLKDEEELAEHVKNEWADFIVTETQKGVNTSTPPANTGKVEKPFDEIMNIKNMSERRKALSEYLKEN